MESDVTVEASDVKIEEAAPQGATTPGALLVPTTVTVTVYCSAVIATGSLHAVDMESTDYNGVLRELLAISSTAPATAEVLEESSPVYRSYPVSSVWTVPTSRRLDQYRRESSRWDRTAEQPVVDQYRLKQRVFLYHLRELTYEGSTPLATREDEQGRQRLTEASDDSVQRLHPLILDTLYLKFRGVSCLG